MVLYGRDVGFAVRAGAAKRHGGKNLADVATRVDVLIVGCSCFEASCVLESKKGRGKLAQMDRKRERSERLFYTT